MVDPMPQYQVYLLQCHFHRIDAALNELKQICQKSDVIVLMEDAVFALEHSLINSFAHVRVFKTAYHSDDIIAHEIHTDLQLIDYDQLSDLIFGSTKVHSWR